MLRSALRRLGQAVLTLIGGGIVTFALMAITPGDPARRVLQGRGILDPTPAQVDAERTFLGLDDPLPQQFWRWFTGVCRGDLGVSWRTGQPVSEEFFTLVPATIRLTVVALALAVAMSLMLGLLAARRPGGRLDGAIRAVSTALVVVPAFLIGIGYIDIAVVKLGWGVVIADGEWGTVFPPALVLAVGVAASWARVLRASLLEAGSAPHLSVSTARGARPLRLLVIHQLPNALSPYLTMVGLGTAALLGGAPIVESVFTWPGVGRYTVLAIAARDMPIVVGFTMIAVTTYVVMSLVVDSLNAVLDPRLRARGGHDPGAEGIDPPSGAPDSERSPSSGSTRPVAGVRP